MAFDDFVAERLDALLRYATVLSYDPHLAKDIVQNVLLRAQQQWPRITAEVDFPAAYVKRVVTNEFLSWGRRKSTREVGTSLHVLDEADPFPQYAPVDGEGEELMSEETVLREALAQHAEYRQGRQEILMALRKPAPSPRSRGRLVWIAAGAAAVAGLTIVGLAIFGNTPIVYAVTKNHNGSVTVSIKDIKAIEPANEKLRELGVRAKAVPQTADCASLENRETYKGSDWDIDETAPDGSVTLGPKLPEGYTVLLSVSGQPGRATGLGFTAPVKDPAPSCVLDPAHDPALRSDN
jgi:DNA-directed RNA polymerase specialized sigma24 family protein